jgi:hypothetical protein
MYDLRTMESAGILVFVPWYLLRKKDVSLGEIAKHERITRQPEELTEWLDGKPEKNFGPDRFAELLEVYVYLELCLKARYGNRLEGKINKIESALGRFLCDDQSDEDAVVNKAESVSKIRRVMEKRLNADAASKSGEG